MSENGKGRFLQGNRIQCSEMTWQEAHEAIVSGMVIRTNYDWEHEPDGHEGTVDYWDGSNYLYLNVEGGDRHYVHWNGAIDNDNWIECPELAKRKKATTLRMDDVVLEKEKKDLIRAAISQVDHYKLIFEEWGFDEVFEKGTAIAVLMWGPPGTGKTIMAQAMANELGLKLDIIQSGEIWSSEPGEAERTIKRKFEEAEKKGNLLLFDECDSLIADRNEVGMILGAQINALLTGLENFRGVVCFTTNRLGTMDPAFERRVSVKVEFPFPHQEQRLKIWKLLIPTKAPINKDVDFTALSHYPIAGGNIKNVILNAARMAAFNGRKDINAECFESAVEKEGEAMKDFEANIARDPRHRMVGGYGPPQMTAKADGGLKLDMGGLETKLEETIEQKEEKIERVEKPAVVRKPRAARKSATKK